MALKAALLALDAVPFDGDEAIVALMARHILRGERPWFFYGQHYMGSLDAYLVAGSFALLGESVLALRVAQVALFAFTLLTGYATALRITADRGVALLATLLMAFPPVLLTLYTTVTLGGYGEVLLAGNLLLWWGHRLGQEDARRWGLWLAWGLVAGLGFWVLGLIVVYLAPVTLWILWCRRMRPWRGYLLAGLGFAVGSLPWWLGGGWLAVGEQLTAAAAPGAGWLDQIGARTLNFALLGLPALFGLRFPWGVTSLSLWLAAPVLALYMGALALGLRRCADRTLLWGVWATLFLGFILTPFGRDPSGRYFLPLYLPLSIFTADALTVLRQRMGRWAWAVLGMALAFNMLGTAQAAATNPPGLTAHFNPAAWVDHRYDQELIRFLRAHGGTRGYAHYWVAYPIAFLSGEEIILAPRLPYKTTLRYSPRDDRYAPYGEWVEQSDAVVYVTTDLPELNTRLRERFAALSVGFRETSIGSYRVFHDLSRAVRPDELSFPLED